jgi:hypothetical protein
MKKIIIMSLGASALLFTACDRDRTTTSSDTTTETTNATISRSGTTASGGMDEAAQDALYREQAIKTSGQMATDLELDTLSQALAEEIYYNRAKHRAEAQQEFADNEYRLNQEMNTIEEETDQQVLGILSYSQSRDYVQNRENYTGLDSAEVNRTGTNQAGGVGTETDGSGKSQTQGAGAEQSMGDDQKTGTEKNANKR